ncbi:hypothetical protein CTAYLR_008494 [Chrysophaeum taylorii]|uniref:Sulfotransferase n=1 Tax=Chrysophaeum taylorii TaxID=2483200 RepID=A0AAD7UCG8_9STRA|nr:hypothetical protein CTAYLR_008494 [Chrysophaeum taylorii]
MLALAVVAAAHRIEDPTLAVANWSRPASRCHPSCSVARKRLFVAISSGGNEAARSRRQAARRTWIGQECDRTRCSYSFFVYGRATRGEKDAVWLEDAQASAYGFKLQQIAWISSTQGADFVLLVDDQGFVRLDRVLDELAIRPKERFAWGTGCGSFREFLRSGFALLSMDVAMVLTRAYAAGVDVDALFPRLRLAVLDDAQRLVAPSITRDAPRRLRFCERYVHCANASDRTYCDNAKVVGAPAKKKVGAPAKKRAMPVKARAAPVIARSARCAHASDNETPSSDVARWWRDADLARAGDDCCAPPRAATEACAVFRGRGLRAGFGEGVVLASFPGSGNTWMRLLLEYGSGVLSGSIYDDASLMRPLPAEGNRHGPSVVAIKAHVAPRQYFAMTGATKVILLTRHPFNAIFAEFQRRIGELRKSTISNAHVHVLESFGDAVKKLFSRYALCMSCKWALYVLQHADLDFLHHVRYEDLVSDAATTTRTALEFAGFRPSAQRLRCAPLLAVDGAVRRNKTKHTAATVFGADKRLACEVWHRATANPASRRLVERFRYEPGVFDCSPRVAHLECADPESKAGNCYGTMTKAAVDRAMHVDGTGQHVLPTTSLMRRRRRPPFLHHRSPGTTMDSRREVFESEPLL